MTKTRSCNIKAVEEAVNGRGQAQGLVSGVPEPSVRFPNLAAAAGEQELNRPDFQFEVTEAVPYWRQFADEFCGNTQDSRAPGRGIFVVVQDRQAP